MRGVRLHRKSYRIGKSDDDRLEVVAKRCRLTEVKMVIKIEAISLTAIELTMFALCFNDKRAEKHARK